MPTVCQATFVPGVLVAQKTGVACKADRARRVLLYGGVRRDGRSVVSPYLLQLQSLITRQGPAVGQLIREKTEGEIMATKKNQEIREMRLDHLKSWCILTLDRREEVHSRIVRSSTGRNLTNRRCCVAVAREACVLTLARRTFLLCLD